MPAPDLTTTTARALAARLRAEGFAEGAPPGLPADALAIDAAAVRRMRCPACRRRGLRCRPYHKGAAYRVLAACPACGAAEEF